MSAPEPLAEGQTYFVVRRMTYRRRADPTKLDKFVGVTGPSVAAAAPDIVAVVPDGTGDKPWRVKIETLNGVDLFDVVEDRDEGVAWVGQVRTLEVAQQIIALHNALLGGEQQ